MTAPNTPNTPNSPNSPNTSNIPHVPSTSNTLEKLNGHRGKALFWVTAILLTLGFIWLLLWLFYFQFHESTDDAYVNGNMINVTPVVHGAPIAFFADNTDLVLQGQLLVLLDSTNYEIQFQKEKANLAETVLKVRQIYNTVEEKRLAAKNKKVAFLRARYDYENRSRLVSSKAISEEDFIHSKDTLSMAELNYQEAMQQLLIAQDAAGNTSLEKHPLLEESKNALREAFYHLKHCSIYAPSTGYVAQRTVEVGQWVTSTTPLMAIIPIDYMWVDANFKETQLTYMRIGQPAKVTFDLYGKGVEVEGKVLGIASGTGSVFSLIPPQNATGNWIKIVQRLPVRIGLDPEILKTHPLRLGLSAYVNVNIGQTDLPMLAQEPRKKTIAETDVFTLNFSEVEALIEHIIQENLKAVSNSP